MVFLFAGVLLWLLCGTAMAYMNFRLAEARKKCVEKIMLLRKEAYLGAKGYRVDVELDDAYEIGMDEDWAMKKVPSLSSAELAGFSVGGIRIMIAFGITLLGPMTCRGILLERRELSGLENAALQLEDLCRQLNASVPEGTH